MMENTHKGLTVHEMEEARMRYEGWVDFMGHAPRLASDWISSSPIVIDCDLEFDRMEDSLEGALVGSFHGGDSIYGQDFWVGVRMWLGGDTMHPHPSVQAGITYAARSFLHMRK